jgi:hypothetical protein
MRKAMDFEEFKKAVGEGIRSWLPEQFENAHVSIEEVTKNNDKKLSGLVVRKSGYNIAPTIYLEGVYELYQGGIELPAILRRIAEMITQHDMRNDFDVNQITDFEKCKDKIFPKLVGAEWNKEALRDCPHVLIEDLAVTFHINLGPNGDQMMSCAVKNYMKKSWGVTTKDLYELAIKNLSENDSWYFAPITEVLADMMKDEAGPDGETDDPMFDLAELPDDMMFVLSVKDRLFGACEILNRKFMEKVVDRVGKELFIIPSSIHELLVLKADGYDPAQLLAMVHEVNHTMVNVEDRLSDNVYKYSLEEGFRIA